MLVVVGAFGYEYTPSPNALDGKSMVYNPDGVNDYVISFNDGLVTINGFSKLLNDKKNQWSGDGSGDDKNDDCGMIVNNSDYNISMTIHHDKANDKYSVKKLEISLRK